MGSTLLVVDEKSLVVQSNKLVEAKYRLSIEEQKIIKILIAQIKRDDEDFKEYEFHVRDLARMLGMEHTNTYGVLEKITERLISRVLKFYNPETETLLQTSWLSSAEYKKGQGTVKMCFDPKLKPLLLQLQSYFTKYELGKILQFKGQYTIRFFEFRKSFIGRNKKEVIFTLKELWEIFGLKKDEYAIFKNFKNRVLEPARLELKEKTGKSFSWEAVRQGRGGKVVGVRIVFDGEAEEEKETVAVQENSITQEKQKQEGNPIIEPEKSKTVALLMDYGISENIAVQLADGRTVDYIQEKIALANAHPEYVKNRAGFIVQAVRENWVDEDIVRMRQEEMRRNAQNEASERRKRLQGIWERYKVQKHNLGLVEFQKRSLKEIERLKEEFLAGLNNFMRNLYQKKKDFGYADGPFRSFFFQKLGNIPTFDMYLVAEGVTLTEEERAMIETEIAR